ncbi:cell division protein FtsN [Bacillus infantis]|uniref:Cell division protein FtsN n=1 Tax=Bacillus infantis TaxID=324767 RepID=A0A5D4SFI2_9BACI|nr:TasA family protein [Bacillus infantis]TYS62040.1 cell division protein FtsN [Bacillus infantis]
MGFKKKLGLGIASAALGMSLVGGGTFAYFNDVEVNNSSFAAGTLDINVKGNDKDNAIIDVTNIKPGDTMTRDFKLNNTGSLNVSKVLLTTEYSVTDVKGNNGTEDLGKHIKVIFLRNNDKLGTEVIKQTYLADLKKSDVVDTDYDLLAWLGYGEEDGLRAGSSDNLKVKFEFVDNGKDQNVFQGDSLKLKWTFDAKQTAGEAK